MVAKVTIKLCTPVFTVTYPLIHPKNVPKIKIKSIDGSVGIPIDSIHHPPNIAVETPIAPRERFKPPVKITTIIASPTIISMDATRDNAYRLNLEENPSVTNEKKIAKNTTRHRSPNWLVRRVLDSLLSKVLSMLVI